MNQSAGRSQKSWEPLDEAHFPERFEAELVCMTNDGVTHRVRIDDVYGSENRPASADNVRAKFRANAALIMTSTDAANLESAVDELDRAKDLTEPVEVVKRVVPELIRNGRKPTRSIGIASGC